MDLGPITSTRREGSEPFRDGDKVLHFDLLAFWQWGVSDIVNNVTRGILAEFLVAKAVGAADGSGMLGLLMMLMIQGGSRSK